MQDDQQPETPLGDVLQPRVKRILERNGIHTVEALRSAYPHQLVKMWGLGMYRFRTIEKAFFPGKSFTPARVYSPVRHIRGSSLNGALDPAIVTALLSAGITTPEQLKAVTPAELLKIKGLGVNRLREIERAFFPGQHSELPRGSGRHCLTCDVGHRLREMETCLGYREDGPSLISVLHF